MKILLLYEYPPAPGGLATQGELLHRGLRENGVEVEAAHFLSPLEKEWYYRWFRPDVVVGVGYWGHVPHLVLHPRQFGVQAVPWLVADGFIADHLETLNSLPLILVTSSWVREVYARDGVGRERIEVLPVGCDTDAFHPLPADDPRVVAARRTVGVAADELMILTVGGDAASKGGREVMRALAMIDREVPPWRYVCKTWPQPRTVRQNALDLQLARELGLADRVVFADAIVSRRFMPCLLSACDLYAAPSRLEGFGMPQVEAGACGKPVIGLRAMAMLDTLVDGRTALLAGVAVENRVTEAVLGPESGYATERRVQFPAPRVADYRANVADVAAALRTLMNDRDLRMRMGAAGRQRAVECYDYRAVAGSLLEILGRRLGIG